MDSRDDDRYRPVDWDLQDSGVIMDEFACAFCLGLTDSDHGPPRDCRHCHMVMCTKCLTWLKEPASFCYGCGAIKPEARAKLIGTYQTACVYMEADWRNRNIGKRDFGFTSKFLISTKINPVKGVFLTKEVSPGEYVDVRELTEEEVKLLREQS